MTIKVSVQLSVVRNTGMKYLLEDMHGFVCCKCSGHTIWELEACQNIPVDVIYADKEDPYKMMYLVNKLQFKTCK